MAFEAFDEVLVLMCLLSSEQCTWIGKAMLLLLLVATFLLWIYNADKSTWWSVLELTWAGGEPSGEEAGGMEAGQFSFAHLDEDLAAAVESPYLRGGILEQLSVLIE